MVFVMLCIMGGYVISFDHGWPCYFLWVAMLFVKRNDQRNNYGWPCYLRINNGCHYYLRGMIKEIIMGGYVIFADAKKYPQFF